MECNPHEARPDLDGGFQEPASRKLANRARDLEAKSKSLTDREVLQDGSVEKTTLEEILADEFFTNPEIIAPATHAVEAWAKSIEAKIQRDRPGIVVNRRMFKLSWRNGEIDREQSSIRFPGTNQYASDPTFTSGFAA